MQCEKAMYCFIPTVWHSGNGKAMEIVGKIKTSQSAGVNREEVMNRQKIENV